MSAGAAARSIDRALDDPAMLDAALALHDNRLADAEPVLRARLKADPWDVAAMRMLAEIAGRIGRFRDAEALLRRALELAPEFGAARANLATLLYKQNRATEALAELDVLIPDDPTNVGHANLKAASLAKLGGFTEAIALYREVLTRVPDQPKVWMSLGHMLKTVGQLDDGVAAYRSALAIAPALGEVWWSLANLKTVRFGADDVAAMTTALGRDDLSDEDRFHLDFALGKAFEDAKDAARAFAHYRAGNALRRKHLAWDADALTAMVDRSIALCDADFFASREGYGDPATDPIFVVGMPRSGSTLVEQILASHSAVEGTSELPDIPALARVGDRYPMTIAELSAEACAEAGAAYLERTRVQRRADRARFIDKLPNNWLHVPFIRLILPNATIIDTRRHPIGCCFSNFKQHFARGQAFSYSLTDMGRYYRDYVRLMTHLDTVQPSRVHRVDYESMVDDPETEIRALLAACGLPFEAACLTFHTTDRAVRTPSSEQVRQPIFRGGVEGWQDFVPYLGELQAALGPLLDEYTTIAAKA